MRSTAFIPILAPTGIGNRVHHAHHLSKRTRPVKSAYVIPLRMTVNSETAATAAIVRTSDTLDESRLSSFETRVRGEWVGYEANFDITTGAPRAIPDYYIPADFVAWGMTPLGFECTHSTIVRGSKYYRKFFRVLPVVALFADHVDLETVFEVVDMSEDRAAHCFADGSFAGGPSPVQITHSSILDKWPLADLCIRDHDGKRAAHARMKFDFENVSLVDNVRVVLESYSCQYCDGADIEGSSGFVEGWAADPKSTPAELAGEWQCDDGSTISRPDGGPAEVPRKCIYLPSGLSLGVSSTDNGVCAWLAWKTAPDERRIMTRYYASDGTVQETKLVTETRQ